ncbi:Rhodanese-related sulfurtransferase [hydrothermal vent metagenome]|uniref:Rhodanese-related sulfurtransferase n=1 Tax=hydrothermal vent metagenome TaxID=652676 RepID=A0A1W1CS78_9ZZZZ
MTYKELVEEALKTIPEVFPWDLEEELKQENPPILLDIREAEEFKIMHIKDSLLVPRGTLEGACEWNFHDTQPILASGREQNIVVICRSGNRSALAGLVMKQLGFKNIRSLKMGIKGWNDNEFPLVDENNNIVDVDEMDDILNQPVPNEKLKL